MQRIVIAIVALALVVPFGAFGLNSLLGPDENPSGQPDRPEYAEPELPPATTEQSEVGATETVRYMLDTYPYMMTSGDVTPWTDVIDPSCRVCTTFVGQAEQLDSQGGYLIDGEFTVSSAQFEGTGEPPETGTVTLQFTQEQSAIVEDETAPPFVLEEVSGELQAQVVWDEDRWRVTDMSLVPDAPTSDGGGAASDGGGAPTSDGGS